MNLMLNGIRGHEEMGAGVNSSSSQKLATAQLQISVSDTRLGLPGRGSGQIFRAFFTTKDNGTGRGWPISRSIVSRKAVVCGSPTTAVERNISLHNSQNRCGARVNFSEATKSGSRLPGRPGP